MHYYAVIDTNVIVSGLLKTGSIPWKILELVRINQIVPIYNEEIIKEYKDVLARNKFGFTLRLINKTLNLIKLYGISIKPCEINDFLVDESDKKFYQIVMSYMEYDESYLVTGNTKHFPKRKFIVTPNEMLSIIKENNNALK